MQPILEEGNLYKAFISHSHQGDREIAATLKRELERFGRPPGARRSMRVFVDAQALVPSESLWNAVAKALDSSEYLLLLASPSSAVSKWCQREIEHWLSHRARANIILVLTKGTIKWDEAAGSFDRQATDALPQALLDAYESEPLYLDITRGLSHSGSVGERSEWHNLAALSALLLNRSRDELICEELSAHLHAEAENQLLRGELSLLRNEHPDAIRHWIDSYFKRPNFVLLQKLVRHFHHHIPQGITVKSIDFTAGFAEYSIDNMLLVGGLVYDGSNELRMFEASTGELVNALACPNAITDYKVCSARSGSMVFFLKKVDRSGSTKLPTAIPESESASRIISSFDSSIRNIHDIACVGFPGGFAIDKKRVRFAFSSFEDIHLCKIGMKAGAPVLKLKRSYEGVMFRDEINEVAFLETRNALAYCTGSDSNLDYWGNEVGILDLNSGKKLWQARGHDKQVNSISLSSTEDRVLTASNDGKVAIWNSSTGELILSWRVSEGPVLCARFLPSGERIVTTTDSGAQIWAAHTGRQIVSLRSRTGLLAIDPIKDRFWVVNDSLLCFDVDRTHQLVNLNGEGKLAGDPAFDELGQRAVTLCRSQDWSNCVFLDVYHARTGEKISSCHPGPDHVSLYGAEISTSGRYLITITGTASQKEDSQSWRIMGSEILLFDANDGRLVRNFDSQCKHVKLDPKERCVLIVTGDEVRLIEIPGGALIASLKYSGTSHVRDVAWHSGGEIVALCLQSKVGRLICRFLRIDWSKCKMRALSPVVSIQSLSTMVFDMSAERLYVTDEEGMVTCVDVGRAYKASPSPFDLRPANTALYARRRSLKQFNDDQMPHQDPYLYTLDGEIMEAMYRDLVDTNVDISYDSEQLLFRVRESLP